MKPWAFVKAMRTISIMALKEQKTALRKRIAGELKKLDSAEIARQCE